MKLDSIEHRRSKQFTCYQLLLAFAFLVIVPARCLVSSPLSLAFKGSSLGGSPRSNPRPHASHITAKSRDDADLLPLTAFDRKKFHHMKTRGRVMPVVFLGEPLIPGQRLHFRSADPKFEQLVKYIAQTEQHFADSGARSTSNIEVGVLGFDSKSGNVLVHGVTAPVRTQNFSYSLTREKMEPTITTSFKGTRFLRLMGTPWLDPSGSFYMAHVEILDGRYDDESLASQRLQIQKDADELFSQIPPLVDDWMELMFEAGLATPASLRESLREVVFPAEEQPMQSLPATRDPLPRTHHRNNNYALYPPRRQKDRAIWVAALLNPIRRYPLTVSNEIRPAFLACRNDKDRLAVCVDALHTSLAYLEVYVEAKRRGGFEKDEGDGVEH